MALAVLLVPSCVAPVSWAHCLPIDAPQGERQPTALREMNAAAAVADSTPRVATLALANPPQNKWWRDTADTETKLVAG